jgi:hypothetical protein
VPRIDDLPKDEPYDISPEDLIPFWDVSEQRTEQATVAEIVESAGVVIGGGGPVEVPGDLVTTGTASTSTFLRGDGSWAPLLSRGEKVFTVPGPLTTGQGVLRIYFPRAATITNVWVSVGTAPTGSSVIFDVHRNGVTLFTTQANRPTIAVSTFVDLASVPDETVISPTDFVTIDVDQVGSTIAGAEAVVGIEYVEAV